MIKPKNKKELKSMKIGGVILGEVLHETLQAVKPGVSELELEKLANSLILKKGGEAGFKKVEGYSHATCISTNDVVVHGIPTKRVLKNGDIIGIDCGVYYGGMHTDMAETVAVGEVSSGVQKFLRTGKKAMYEGIKQAKLGNRVGHISKAMQDIVEAEGYGVVRSLVGHGVGRELHEEPEIPGYLTGKIEKTPELVPGMTIAVEIIYTMGSNEVIYDVDDDWTISTQDGSLAGLFERTIVVGEDGPQLITCIPGESL